MDALSQVTFVYKSFQFYESISYNLKNELTSELMFNTNDFHAKNELTIQNMNTHEDVNEPNKDTSFEDYFDPKFPRWISIVLLIVGLFGNTLCLVIFSQKSMRKYSTFIYLAFLAIVDLFVLTLGLGDMILISYFKFVLRNRSLFLCRFLSFLIYVFTHLSSFILASVSIDRAIATNFITFSKIYCKPKTAYKIIFLNVLIAAIINFHSLIFLGYETQNLSNTTIGVNYINLNSSGSMGLLRSTSYECASEKDTLYDRFLDPYFKWIDLLSYAIAPFFTMGVCTFLIVRVLYLSNRRLNKNKPKSVKIEKKSDQKATLLNKKATNARSNKAIHLTYTLITLNCLFFCLVSPLVIVLIVVTGQETEGINKIVINIVYLLAYSNHSFNFILYGVSSPPFRESLFKLFRIKQNKTLRNSINVKNNCLQNKNLNCSI